MFSILEEDNREIAAEIFTIVDRVVEGAVTSVENEAVSSSCSGDGRKEEL